MRARAVLINTATNQPIDPAWQPMIDPQELEDGNRRLANNGLAMQWKWASSLLNLAGAVTLSAAASAGAHKGVVHDTTVQLLAAGPGL